MLSLEEDIEKIKELENTINNNNNDFKIIKDILNKYESNINDLKQKIGNLQELSQLSFLLIILSYDYNNPLNHIIFSILSGFLIYKSAIYINK